MHHDVDDDVLAADGSLEKSAKGNFHFCLSEVCPFQFVDRYARLSQSARDEKQDNKKTAHFSHLAASANENLENWFYIYQERKNAVFAHLKYKKLLRNLFDQWRLSFLGAICGVAISVVLMFGRANAVGYGRASQWDSLLESNTMRQSSANALVFI
jgi:hypothetical protein